jgi:hypothetical protein
VQQLRALDASCKIVNVSSAPDVFLLTDTDRIDLIIGENVCAALAPFVEAMELLPGDPRVTDKFSRGDGQRMFLTVKTHLNKGSDKTNMRNYTFKVLSCCRWHEEHVNKRTGKREPGRFRADNHELIRCESTYVCALVRAAAAVDPRVGTYGKHSSYSWLRAMIQDPEINGVSCRDKWLAEVASRLDLDPVGVLKESGMQQRLGKAKKKKKASSDSDGSDDELGPLHPVSDGE